MTRNKSGNDMPSALDAKTYNSTCGFIVPRTIPTISSVTVTNGYTWPDWNYVPKEFCPPGSAAVAFTLKVQARMQVHTPIRYQLATGPLWAFDFIVETAPVNWLTPLNHIYHSKYI
jgi:hypothetical protein